MAQIAGNYQLVKNDKFSEYLITVGIPEEKAMAIDAIKNTLEVTVDGQKISFKTTPSPGNNVAVFVLDQEVDEVLATGTLKSTAKLNGSTLTITSKQDANQTINRVYEFSADQLEVTYTSDNAPVAKRFYKRI